ncbi:MAG: hypothetical protein ACN4GR_17340 [Arenicellales bacterium]
MSKVTLERSGSRVTGGRSAASVTMRVVRRAGDAPPPEPPTTYLLKASFDAPDAVYTAGQVLGVNEGVEVGALTVNLLSATPGRVETVNNQLRVTSGSGVRDDGPIFETGVQRAIGKPVLVSLVPRTGSHRATFFLCGTPSLSDTNINAQLQFTSIFRIAGFETFALDPLAGLEYDVQIRVAIVLGGVNSARKPYQLGDNKEDFKHGASVYATGGIFPDWTMIWRGRTVNSNDTVYPALSLYSANDVIEQIEDFHIHDVDLSAMQVPDFMTDSVVPGYTFTHAVNANIQFLMATTPTAGNFEFDIRKASETEKWKVVIGLGGVAELVEVTGGVSTTRIGPVDQIVPGQGVHITVDDEKIMMFGKNDIGSYAGAASNKTETAGEVTAMGTSTVVDWLAGWDRLNSSYAVLDDY